MKNMKNKVLIPLVLAVSFQATVYAGDSEVGTQFTYQGELIDNGSPADGSYDFEIAMYDSLDGGFGFIDQVELDDVPVSQGLFSVILDYGDSPFNGDELFLEIQVRAGESSGGYEALMPRQRINVTPYAIQAEFAENGDSPWTDNGNDISYSQRVFVGNRNTVSSSQLTIESPANESPLRVFVNGTTRMIVQENGGTSIGINQAAPSRGLNVRGDATQGLDAHGFVKAGVIIECGEGDVGTSSNSTRFFNNVNDNDFTSTRTGPNGSCEITVPFDITEAFYTLSASASGGAALFESIVGSCSTIAADTLACQLHSISGANTALNKGVLQLVFY